MIAKAPQAGSRVAAQDRGHRRPRKLSVGPFREHTHAGGGAHQTVERFWVSSDLLCQLVGRFGSSLDEVGDAELGEARDGARDASPIHELENADMCAELEAEAVASFVVHLNFTFGDISRRKYTLNDSPRFIMLCLSFR